VRILTPVLAVTGLVALAPKVLAAAGEISNAIVPAFFARPELRRWPSMLTVKTKIGFVQIVPNVAILDSALRVEMGSAQLLRCNPLLKPKGLLGFFRGQSIGQNVTDHIEGDVSGHGADGGDVRPGSYIECGAIAGVYQIRAKTFALTATGTADYNEREFPMISGDPWPLCGSKLLLRKGCLFLHFAPHPIRDNGVGSYSAESKYPNRKTNTLIAAPLLLFGVWSACFYAAYRVKFDVRSNPYGWAAIFLVCLGGLAYFVAQFLDILVQ
jgi:hypothetical protein